MKAIAILPRCRNCGRPMLHADQRCDSMIGKWCHVGRDWDYEDFDANPMGVPPYYPNERLQYA